MPKKVARNCFLCSKLSNDEAQAKSCWDAVRCPNRRHYQCNKERISQQRKTQAKLSDYPEKSMTTASGKTIAIDHPISTAVSIIFYRERQNAPVHAIALCALRKESLLKYGRATIKYLLYNPCTV
jgi:hypothetical protein